MKDVLTIAEVDASKAGYAVLTRFYHELYVRNFPDAHERESLGNMKQYLALKASGWYGANNYHVLILCRNGAPVGGAIFDYLVVPNAGVIEFLFTDASTRAMGLGRVLLSATLLKLKQDARRSGRPLPAVLAEMNDPFKRTDVPDNMDPFERAVIWGRWGFVKLDFPYVQPALSRRQRAVECLVLIMKSPRALPASGVPATWLLSAIREYMRWAMRISAPSRNPQYREMARVARTRRRVPVISLSSYVGREARKALEIRPINRRDPALRPLHRLLQQEIPASERVAGLRDFRRALSQKDGAFRYHLWGLAQPRSAKMEGLASFFTFRSGGFGGYIVLSGKLRAKGFLRPLVARIEERMIKDNTGATRWFIECDENSMAAFVAVGFRQVPAMFAPPNIRSERRDVTAGKLHLLHKPFGNHAGGQPLPLAAVLACLKDILRHVYQVARPMNHHCYRMVERTWRHREALQEVRRWSEKVRINSRGAPKGARRGGRAWAHTSRAGERPSTSCWTGVSSAAPRRRAGGRLTRAT